jgi:hypothetical protein
MSPQPLQFVQFLRHLLGQVFRLTPVLGGVVEFPHIVVEGRGFLTDEDPRYFVPGHGGPTLVVDAAIAEHLEVLRLVAVRCLGIVEGVEHAHSFDGVLLHAVDEERLGQPRRLEQRRRDVDHMMELPPHLALASDALGPVHDCSVARAAPVGRDLLGPLIRGVHGMRPAHGIVVVGLRSAQLVEPLHQELRGLDRRHAVEVEHLVERPVERALRRGAVVADDVVDQGVVEHTQLLHAVQQAADVVVGVFQEARIHLHLAAQHWFERLRHVIPRGYFLVAGGELAIRRAGGQRR